MSEYKLTTVCYAAALALVLAACSSSDNETATVEPEPTPPTVEPDPELTDLETAQAAAIAAAAAAKMASDNAAMAASDAADAIMNLATMQTGAMSMSQADEAEAQADDAMEAYMAAKAASDAAAAATDIDAAVTAKNNAVAAQADAEAAAMKASEYGTMAMESATGELMIAGTMKSVGETTIDAMAPRSEVTSGSGDDEQKTITGLISTPLTTGLETDGLAEVDAVINTDPPTSYTAPKVNAAARDNLEIGKVVDSADDMARLRIITAYASTRSVKVYDIDPNGTAIQSHKAGMIRLADGADTIVGTDDDVMATLRPVGMFYLAAGGTTPGMLEPMGPSDADPPAQQGDTVAAGEKPKQVYSYVAADDTTQYVVLNETVDTTDNAGMATTVYSYLTADIHHMVNRDGIGATDGAGDENVFVTAALPVAKSYDHVHFGVWAGLGEAAKDGSQKIADLGIGFVQSIGDGMTGADMPNNGTVTYTGNWAGTVQESHPDGEGAITSTHGNAEVTARFSKYEITAKLTGLATLKGAITGNTFSGVEASDLEGKHGLDTEATFTGEFAGGFYGEKAAEAAGIFSFSSEEDNEGGAFNGAFGGAKGE